MTTTLSPVKKNARIGFEMHQNLLMHTIKRQAGTLGKAAIEAVMNSIDAGATRIDITLDKITKVLTISDNGRGIKTRGEIEQYFKIFGQPHAQDTEGNVTDAQFGEFRMGRGQLFAHGVNVWLTHDHRLDVDIENHGMTFGWEKAPMRAGCHVEVQLYDVCGIDDQIESLGSDIGQLVRFSEVSVYFNGELKNTPPATAQWTHETKDFYVLHGEGSSGLQVYQMGILVETIPHWQHGFSGVAVSRKPMKLNYARNSVMRSCKQWEKLRRIMDTLKKKRNPQRPLQLSSAGRVARILEITKNREVDTRMPKEKLFTDVTGTAWSLEQLRNLSRRGFTPAPPAEGNYSFAKEGDVMGETLMRRKRAVIFSWSMLEDLQMARSEAPKFFARVFGADSSQASELAYVPFEDLVKEIDPQYELISPQNYTKREKAFIRFLTDFNRVACGATREGSWSNIAEDMREILIGTTTTGAEAWTDGKGRGYIAFERKTIAKAEWNFPSLDYLASILVHEYCHGEADTDTHIHTKEFYEQFHEAELSINHKMMRASYIFSALKAFTRNKKMSQRMELVPIAPPPVNS